MQLRTEIEIDAPIALVWRVLMEVQHYHEWNPFITSLEGELSEGSRINVVISPTEGSDLRFRPLVLRVQPEKELRWRGRVISDLVFVGEHYFLLQEVGPARTRVTHGEDFRGVLLRFLGKQMTATARGFVFMNQALKRRAEALVTRAAG